MRRLFIAGETVRDGRIFISGKDNIHYLSVVLRMKQSDSLFVSDGAGKAYGARILRIDKNEIELDIESEHQAEEMYNTFLTLYQGLPKGSKMDDIVRKTSELGVFRIVPTLTGRSVPNLKDGAACAKTERWRRIAKEAARQSMRISIPDVTGIMGFEDAVAGLRAEGYDLILVPDELEEGFSLKRALRREKQRDLKKLAVFIGPEGGFERDETDSLLREGASPVSLGETILRTETAGFATLAMILYELEL